MPRLLTCLSLLLLLCSRSLAQPVSSAFLQGSWRVDSVWQTSNDYMVQEYFPPAPADNIWIFKNDTLTQFFFPYQVEQQLRFTADSTRIYFTNGRWTFSNITLDSGKIIITTGDGYAQRLERAAFSADTLKIIRMLSRNGIDPGKLLAHYQMVTHFIPDDEAAYDYLPPVKMPRTLSFTDSASALHAYQTHTLYVQAGNKEQPFDFSVSWESAFYEEHDTRYVVMVPVITLHSRDWWTGEPFWVVYRAREKDIARMQR